MTDNEPKAIFAIWAGHYEWCELRVYRHPAQEQHYVVFSGSGCSCNSFDEPDEEDVRAAEPLNRAEVRRRVLTFIEQYHYWITAGDGIRYLEQLETVLRADATA